MFPMAPQCLQTQQNDLLADGLKDASYLQVALLRTYVLAQSVEVIMYLEGGYLESDNADWQPSIEIAPSYVCLVRAHYIQHKWIINALSRRFIEKYGKLRTKSIANTVVLNSPKNKMTWRSQQYNANVLTSNMTKRENILELLRLENWTMLTYRKQGIG